jgi:hypothetical protein
MMEAKCEVNPVSMRSSITDAEHYHLVQYIKNLRLTAPDQVDPDSWIVEGLLSKGWVASTTTKPSLKPRQVDPPKNPWPFVVESDVDYD